MWTLLHTNICVLKLKSLKKDGFSIKQDLIDTSLLAWDKYRALLLFLGASINYVDRGGSWACLRRQISPKICSLFIRKNRENHALQFLLHRYNAYCLYEKEYIFFYRNHEISVKFLCQCKPGEGESISKILSTQFMDAPLQSTITIDPWWLKAGGIEWATMPRR